MVNSGYIFDVIIVRIDVPGVLFEEPNELVVDVEFNSVSLKITSSRINVVDFRSGRSYEFDANSEELRRQMENWPMKMEVRYKHDVVGKAEMSWPHSVLDKICENAGEFTHLAECDLNNGSEKVGTIQVIVRLKIKCEEPPYFEMPKHGVEIRQKMDNLINPHDVLFVVGENQRDEECENLIEMSQNRPTKGDPTLDLSYYRHMNGQLVQTADILDACLNTDCCDLKKMKDKYEGMINSFNCKDRPQCTATKHAKDCPHEHKFSSSSTRDSSDCKISSCFEQNYDTDSLCGCGKGRNMDDMGGQFMNMCPSIPPPKLTQTVHRTPRHCPVCKENITWLPKIAACPKCGYKIVPFVEEKPYDTKLTADEILKEYLNKRTSETDEICKDGKADQNQQEENECRCTCKLGKTCAYCRIRKLCEDVFKSKTNDKEPRDEDCGKCEVNSSELFNICKTSSKECRPYLARVFSELKDLYDIKETKRKSFTVDPKCEKALGGQVTKKGKSKTDKQRLSASKRVENHTESGEHEAKEQRRSSDARKSAKKEEKNLHNNKAEKKKCKRKRNEYVKPSKKTYTGSSKMGHKTCINGYAGGRKNVPPNMGWLWNLDSDVVRRGWKPGAIRKPIKELMRYFLKDFPADTIRVSQYSYRNRLKGGDYGEEEEMLIQKPTLHICKKNDEVYVTLRPLKDPDSLKECADPYLDMKPIQFKIVKNPMVYEMRKLKRCLKDMGFNKCTCHKPVVECFCRSFLDKKRLEYQVAKECRKRKLDCCNDTLVLSDTTDSDAEFDFSVTPPAGVIKPERLHKPNLVNHATQYVEGDWNIAPMFPKPANRYLKLCNCVTGLRYDMPLAAKYGKSGRGGRGRRGGGAEGAGRGGGGGRGGRGGIVGIPGNPCPPQPRAASQTCVPPPGYGPGGFGPGGPNAGRGGRGGGFGRGVPSGPGGAKNPDEGRVDMMQYLRNKGGMGKGGTSAEEKAKKLRALGQVPPPILCMIERRGKPESSECCYDYCCPPRNNRIC